MIKKVATGAACLAVVGGCVTAFAVKNGSPAVVAKTSPKGSEVNAQTVPALPPQPPDEFVTVPSNTSTYWAGDEAGVTVKTLPGSQCSIEVDYKSGPSHAQGLVPATADSGGSVSWTWRIGTNTTPGDWPVKVTCTSGGQTKTGGNTLYVENANYSDDDNQAVVTDAQLEQYKQDQVDNSSDYSPPDPGL